MKKAKRTMEDLFRDTPTKVSSEAPKTGKKPKRRLRFWFVYFVCLACATLLVAGAILAVNVVLRDYESARPGYVAEEVFDEYFVDADASQLLEKSGFCLSFVEGKDDFTRYWQEHLDGELTLVRVSADNGGETVRYNVRAGEKTLAAFDLALSEEKTKFGNPLYALEKIELGVGAKHSARVSVPTGCVPSFNGVALTQQEIVEKDIPTSSTSHMPEGVEGITYTTYEVKGMLYAPEIVVKDINGQENTVVYDETTRTYVAEIRYDDALKEEMQDYVISAAQTYAAAMQNDRSRSAALAYIDRNSELYTQTLSLDLFVSAHSGYRFEKTEASEFYSYDDSTFSCRVSFVHVLTGGSTRFDANGENRENVDITWYFRKVGDRWLVYDRENR